MKKVCLQNLWVILSLLQGFWLTPVFAYDVITYANGQVLRDAQGNIYNHRGEKFISTDGTMTYPSWLGGRKLRANEGMGSYPWKLYYANGSKLVEFQYQVYYPTVNGATTTHQLYDGWTFHYSNGQEALSNNWRDAESIYHSNSVKAWDGRTIRNAQNQAVAYQQIWERFGNSGYMYLFLDSRSGAFQLSTSFVFDLLQSSYVYPIIFDSGNGLPGPLFEKFSVQLETGYWGELVTVYVNGSNVTSKFEHTGIPAPYPWPDPCPVQILQYAGRPGVMKDRPDPNGFVRRQSR